MRQRKQEKMDLRLPTMANGEEFPGRSARSRYSASPVRGFTQTASELMIDRDQVDSLLDLKHSSEAEPLVLDGDAPNNLSDS